MLHRIFCVIMAIFMVISLSSTAQAATEFTYEAGNVDLVCPDGWTHEMGESKITMSSPEGAISFIFDLVDGEEVEKGLEKASKEIVEALGATTFGEPTEEKINGMDVITFEGTCEAPGVSVMVSVINTPSENALLMYYFGAKAAEETYGPAIAEIVQGIKPATAAAATETVEEVIEEEVVEGEE